jgi:hypothetical protein
MTAVLAVVVVVCVIGVVLGGLPVGAGFARRTATRRYRRRRR